MRLKFKNRIAIFNTLAVAIITALVFCAIYLVVHRVAYGHLDEDIYQEKEEVVNNLQFEGDSVVIYNMPEWEEAEHSQVEVNPTFIQISDAKGHVIFRSANLLNDQELEFTGEIHRTYIDSQISGQKIRLGSFPLQNAGGKNIGIISIAVSEEESYAILQNLVMVLLIAFPLVLLAQFLASSIAASRSIRPVHKLIETASGISDTNISERLELPSRQDELYLLGRTINELLDRIEKSVEQQKQFTSDASHEIRTPLSAIRGTLEVLLRRRREPEAYEEKLNSVIDQVDRLDALLEQLLQLARIETPSAILKYEPIDLLDAVRSFEEKWKSAASLKNISIFINIPENISIKADKFYLGLILDNLVNNAIKYGRQDGAVRLDWENPTRMLSIEDDGIGIAEEHLHRIFDRFYRSDESRSSLVKGSGLGLSIVKRLADLQGIFLDVKSTEEKGSIFSLHFS